MVVRKILLKRPLVCYISEMVETHPLIDVIMLLLLLMMIIVKPT